jgi:hypothetical protein
MDCPHCAESIPNDSIYCPECGKPIALAARQEPEGPSATPLGPSMGPLGEPSVSSRPVTPTFVPQTAVADPTSSPVSNGPFNSKLWLGIAAGLVIAFVFLVALALLILEEDPPELQEVAGTLPEAPLSTTTAPTTTASAPSTSAAILADSALVSELLEGECFRGDPVFLDQPVAPVECEVPHDGELFLVTEVPEIEDYPLDDDASYEMAFIECEDEFAHYVDTPFQDSVLWLRPVFTSTAEQWATGERNLVCFIYVGDENGQFSQLNQLSGSMEGSGL